MLLFLFSSGMVPDCTVGEIQEHPGAGAPFQARWERLMVPFLTLRRGPDRVTGTSLIFVVDGNGKAVAKSIGTGIRHENQVEILESLKPGVIVINKGLLELSNGMPVQPVPSTSVDTRMSHGARHTGGHATHYGNSVRCR